MRSSIEPSSMPPTTTAARGRWTSLPMPVDSAAGSKPIPADKLIISAKTVDSYRSRIMEKLQLHHRSEIVKFALRHGLLSAST